MGKTGIVVAIVLAIIVMFGGLVTYSYTQIHVDLNDVNYHSIDWAPLSFTQLLNLGVDGLSENIPGPVFDLIDGINLELIFGLSNNGFLPVYIPSITYDLSINDVFVSQGNRMTDFISNQPNNWKGPWKGFSIMTDFTINPGQIKQITENTDYTKNDLTSAASTIIANGGIIDLKVSGTAYLKLFELSIPIPFESSKKVSIIDEVKKEIGEIQEQNKK